MAELRWNPILKDWVMNVSSRQKRPNMRKDFCPFNKKAEIPFNEDSAFSFFGGLYSLPPRFIIAPYHRRHILLHV